MLISESQFLAMKARTMKAVKSLTPEDAWTGREADLHNEIVDELRRRRWFFIHSRCDRATTQAKGVPDFICCAPGGLVYFCEVKRKGGKLTPEQNVTRHVLTALGHRFAVVYSFQQFLDFINQ